MLTTVQLFACTQWHVTLKTQLYMSRADEGWVPRQSVLITCHRLVDLLFWSSRRPDKCESSMAESDSKQLAEDVESLTVSDGKTSREERGKEEGGDGRKKAKDKGKSTKETGLVEVSLQIGTAKCIGTFVIRAFLVNKFQAYDSVIIQYQLLYIFALPNFWTVLGM